MACEPFDCDVCHERHVRCAEHRIACSDKQCNWSGGNVKVRQPCVKCEKPCDIHPCMRWPMKEMTVCEFHGAGTDASKKASKRRVVEKQVRKEVVKMLGDREPRQLLNPYQELADLATEILDVKDFFRERVAELTSLKDVGGEKIATQIDVLVSAYERGLDRSERTLSNIVRMQLDEHIAQLQARVDFATAEIVRGALAAALGTTPIAPDLKEQILREFGARLRPDDGPAALAS